MIKTFEIKYIINEKEKNKIIKLYNEINIIK